MATVLHGVGTEQFCLWAETSGRALVPAKAPRGAKRHPFALSAVGISQALNPLAGFLLGEQFDDDPFLLLRLRGRTREAVTAGLRARRAAAWAGGEEAAQAHQPQAPAAPAARARLADELLWVDRVSGAVIAVFGLLALASLLQPQRAAPRGNAL